MEHEARGGGGGASRVGLQSFAPPIARARAPLPPPPAHLKYCFSSSFTRLLMRL